MPPPSTRPYSVMSVAATALGLATETVSATIGAVDVPDPATLVRFFGVLVFTGQAGSTTTVVRIRRVGLGGTQVVSTTTVATAGANVFSVPIGGDDAPGDAAGLAYVLTATCAGAAGTNVLSYLLALVG